MKNAFLCSRSCLFARPPEFFTPMRGNALHPEERISAAHFGNCGSVSWKQTGAAAAVFKIALR